MKCGWWWPVHHCGNTETNPPAHVFAVIRCVQKHHERRRGHRCGGGRKMMRVRHPRKIMEKITRKHDEPDDPTPTHECRDLRRRQVGRRCVRLCADLTGPEKPTRVSKEIKTASKTRRTRRPDAIPYISRHPEASGCVFQASGGRRMLLRFGCGRVLKT